MKLGTFQNFTVGIAIILLVISVASMGMVLSKTNGYPYPGSVDVCPDYWTTINTLTQPSGECADSEFGCCSDHATLKTDAGGTNCPVKCYNTHGLGAVSSSCANIPTTMDFSSTEFTGANGQCAKKKWADNCGLTWDGVTNMTGSCS